MKAVPKAPEPPAETKGRKTMQDSAVKKSSSKANKRRREDVQMKDAATKAPAAKKYRKADKGTIYKERKTIGRGSSNDVNDLFAQFDDEKTPDEHKQCIQAICKKLWSKVEKQCRTELTCMEFCCGGGGLALGLKRAGFNKLALVDILPVAVQTNAVNNEDDIVLCANLLDVYGLKDGFNHLDLLCAGLPCQSFSLLGKRETWEHDKKGTSLWDGFLKICNSLQPKLIMIENVSPCAGDIMRSSPEILSNFDAIGYRLTNRVLDSNTFNVPQARKRMFLVAVNKRLCTTMLNYNTIPNDLRFPTYEDVFQMRSGPVDSWCTTLGSAKLNEVIEKLRPGQKFMNLPKKDQIHAKTVLGLHLRDTDLRRPALDRPCPTITTSGGAQSGWGCILHPRESRPLNVIEAARVQTFPDEWEWGCRPDVIEDTYLQIGNAVPCNMGEHMGWALNRLLAETAQTSPEHFSPIEDKVKWLDEHVKLFNGDRSSSMVQNHLLEHPLGHLEQGHQYRGCYWRMDPDFETQDQWKPDTEDFLLEDEVTVELFDGKKQIAAHGVVTVRTKTTIGIEMDVNGVKMYHALQKKYKKFAAIKDKKLPKNSDFVVTGVRHFKYEPGMNIVRTNFSHYGGQLVSTCRRSFSGRQFSYLVPTRRLFHQTKITDRCGRNAKEHLHYHKIQYQHLPSTNRFNQPTLTLRALNKDLFTPLFIRVEGHAYPKGTKIDINQVNTKGKKTRHWSGATILDQGFDKNGKEWRMIKLDSLKVIPTQLAKKQDLFEGKPKNQVVKAYVQVDGRFRIKYGLYLDCRPVAEAKDVKRFIGDGKTDNVKDRQQIIGSVKLACRWKNSLWGEVVSNNKNEKISIVSRRLAKCHSYNSAFGEGVVKCLQANRWKQIKAKQSSEPRLPNLGSSEYGVLTRTGTIERVHIRGISEFAVAMVFADGHFEAHPKDQLLFEYLGAPSKKEAKTWNAIKKSRDIPLANFSEGDDIATCRETGKVLGRGRGAGRPSKDGKPKKKTKKKKKDDDFVVDDDASTRRTQKTGAVSVAERCSIGAHSNQIVFTPYQFFVHNKGVILESSSRKFDIPSEADLRELDWATYQKMEKGQDLNIKRKKKQGGFEIGWFNGVKWEKGVDAPGPLNFKKGEKFNNRGESYWRGLHRQTMRGIDCGPNGVCESVCFGGGYADDTHDLDVEKGKRKDLWYTGEGFEKSGDQKLTKGNLGMKLAYDRKQSVRVLMKKLKNPERKGDGFYYEFPGMYKIVECILPGQKDAKSEHLMQKVMKVRLKWDTRANNKLKDWTKKDQQERDAFNSKAEKKAVKKAAKEEAKRRAQEAAAKKKKGVYKRRTKPHEKSFIDSDQKKAYIQGTRLGEYGTQPEQNDMEMIDRDEQDKILIKKEKKGRNSPTKKRASKGGKL